ncbi:MAG: hypothetical protein FJX48_10195 [Alphaproteobacteria bacterium]|nr:hypothetical protein [Alphaproteobacteria bacterium]
MSGIPFSVQFGSLGDYRLWAGDGWLHDNNDKQHTWTGHIAKLRFKMDFIKNDLILKVDVIPLAARGVEQELYVFINGVFVAFWPVLNAGVQSTRIETVLLQSGDWLVTFLMPKAICPRDLGVSQDQRTLGVAFRSLSLSPAK